MIRELQLGFERFHGPSSATKQLLIRSMPMTPNSIPLSAIS
jgi:hypothetical protein